MRGKIGILALVFAFVIFAGCNHLHSIYEVSDHPVPPRAQTLPLREIRNAILDAAHSRRWVVEEIGRHKLRATYAPRRFKAVVIITYGRKKYSIVYHDSHSLRYGGGLIHRNYNKWIRNLERDIHRILRKKAVRLDPVIRS